MLTLQALLDVRRLRLRARHVPDPGVTVRWVATSELPDPTPFLRDGEVLLTTGLEAGGWAAAEWSAYVERLAAAGVAGLGFGVGLSHRSVPDPLLEACREHGVALFEVPRATTFVAVSEAAAGLLQEGEAQAARDALDAHRRLARAALRDDPDELLREVAGLGVAAGIAGPGGVLEAGPYGDRPDVLIDPGVAATIAQIRPSGLRGAGVASTAEATVLVHPLGVSGRPGRWLLTGFAGPVDDVRRGAVNAAVALLGLAEERRRAAGEADRMLRSRAVELVVGGDARSAAVVLAATTRPPRLPDPLVVLRVAGPEDLGQDALEALDPRWTVG
ncbi:MAG: PucR family transcriptional regulator ligand-binding domain-containing protein, partial [Actinobacteria bacterium]|nr:PucR family transcriptional regulator ligand-binding domain-containing protein [Actinomycetota bacterium]